MACAGLGEEPSGGGMEYKCWEEQERGSDRQGLTCQARRLALTEKAAGSPCRFLAGVTIVRHLF